MTKWFGKRKMKPLPRSRQCTRRGCRKEGFFVFEVPRPETDNGPRSDSKCKLCHACAQEMTSRMDLSEPGNEFIREE